MKKTYIIPTSEVYCLGTTVMLLIGSSDKISVDGTEEAYEGYSGGGDARIHIESDGTNFEW